MKKGTKVAWMAQGPWGETWREGVIRARVKKGQEIKLPKRADSNKLVASLVNSRYDRYLVEIERVDGRNGKKLASKWMAPHVDLVDVYNT